MAQSRVTILSQESPFSTQAFRKFPVIGSFLGPIQWKSNKLGFTNLYVLKLFDKHLNSSALRIYYNFCNVYERICLIMLHICKPYTKQNVSCGCEEKWKLMNYKLVKVSLNWCVDQLGPNFSKHWFRFRGKPNFCSIFRNLTSAGSNHSKAGFTNSPNLPKEWLMRTFRELEGPGSIPALSNYWRNL